jgi:predicted DNA-binding transcriptional regulator AlpA
MTAAERLARAVLEWLVAIGETGSTTRELGELARAVLADAGPPPEAPRLLRGPEVWSTSQRRGRLPISRSTWLNGVRDGSYPAGRWLSPHVRVWTEAEIAEVERRGKSV